MNRRLIHTRARDRGAVIPIVALLLPVLMVMTGFAVDLGQQRSDRRSMQAVADVVALDMSRLADDRTLLEIQQGTGPVPPYRSAAVALAQAAARNSVDVSQLTVTWGTFDRATEVFTAITDPAAKPDAAHVRAVDTTDYRFQPGSGEVTREAVAQLGRVQSAQFKLGSTLIGLSPSQGWFLGQLLSFIIPGADLIGYGGLANAQVTLGDLALALGAGSVEELADLKVTYEDLLLATAEVLSAQKNTVGLGVINQLLALNVKDVTVRIGDLLGVDTMDPDAGLVGTVDVPGLLSTGAVLAGGTNFVRIPSSQVNLAGLGTLDIALHVIEGPIRVGTEDRASGTTKQIGVDVRLGLNINGTGTQDLCALDSTERGILASIVSGLLTGLSCTIGAVINRVVSAQVTGDVLLALSVASVTATQSIRCAADRLQIAYGGNPLMVTTTADVQTKVTLADTELPGLLAVQIPPGPLVAADGASGTVAFDVTDPGPVHRAFADTVSGKPTVRIGAPTLGLAGLIRTDGINVRLLRTDIPIVGNLAKGLVEPMLNSILAGLDQYLVAQVSQLLGLNLGGADITPEWMDCDDDGSVQLVG